MSLSLPSPRRSGWGDRELGPLPRHPNYPPLEDKEKRGTSEDKTEGGSDGGGPPEGPTVGKVDLRTSKFSAGLKGLEST